MSREPNSVFQQQLRNFPPGKADPRKAFLEDLHRDLSQWIADGDVVLVMLDANESVLSGPLFDMFSSLLLVNLHCRDAHDRRHYPPLPTCSRADPIDAMFGTPGLSPVSRGYTAPGVELSTDHSILWVDISLESIFGSVVPVHLPLSSPSRLTCQDPRVVAKYNQLFLAYLQEHRLSTKAFQLQLEMAHLSPSELQSRYDSLDAQRLRGMQYAEAHCRKLRMGAHSHFPAYSDAGQQVSAWKTILRRAQGHPVDFRYWRRCLRRVQWTLGQAPTVEEASASLSAAYCTLRLAQKSSPQKRDAWQTELATARSEQRNTTVA